MIFSKKYIAVVPLVQYITGFCVSFAMKPLAKHLGKVSSPVLLIISDPGPSPSVLWVPGALLIKYIILEWYIFPWCNPNYHCIHLGNNSRWGYVLLWCLHFGISFWCWNNNSSCTVTCNHCWAHWRKYIDICFRLWCNEFNRYFTNHMWLMSKDRSFLSLFDCLFIEDRSLSQRKFNWPSKSIFNRHFL